MRSIKKLFSKRFLQRLSLFDALILLGTIASGALSWLATSFLKHFLFQKSDLVLYPWTAIVANPDQSSLINYVGACLGMFLYGALCYSSLSKRLIGHDEPGADKRLVQFIIILSLVLVVLFLRETVSYRTFINATFAFMLLVPLRYAVSSLKKLNRSFLLMVITGILFILVSLEPLALIKGPVYLLNEYRKPFSQTLLNGSYVKNDLYLQEIRNVNDDQFVKTGIADFYKKNTLEYGQQNSGRGQVHHIGHILNPINEYESGKSYRDLYMQYGFGNALLFKWTMNLFGGISIQNYYKCYVYYVVYVGLFLLMAYVVFGNTIYLLGVFSIFVISHFAYDYLVFIVAPGIIPSLHIFDVVVIIFLYRYLQKGSLVYLAAATGISGLSLVLNFQFGALLTISLILALMFYLTENTGHRIPRVAAVLVLVLFLVISAFVFINSRVQINIFSYFAFGLFSWMPPLKVIILTMLYLSASYYFLSILREQRFGLKYLYFFVFVYTQALFTYYYWSGLSSHLPLVVPFIGLQIFLMIFILVEKLPNERRDVIFRGNAGVRIVALFLVILALSAMNRFYRGKESFLDNFTHHQAYNWIFERANVITTIEPEPIEESIALIKKYSTGKNQGIYLLSEYDNLLPFLANRYSMMPLFDMSWYIMSEKEKNTTIDSIQSQQPQFIFVDTDIDKGFHDPWEKLFDGESDKKERASHAGRYSELRKIYLQIKNNYQKIEEGSLISVYKRAGQ